jgi:phenylacetate-CoA ligase
LGQLATISMQHLKDYRTLERASKSTLYRERWRAAGIRPEEIETYEDFIKIPFITSRDLRKAINEDPLEKVLCSEEVVHWFSTTGTTGMPKWMPYGQRDIELFMDIRDRAYSLLPLTEGLKGFAVVAPPPFVENGLAVLNTIRGIITDTNVGGPALSLTEVEHEDAVKFALDVRPNMLAAFPGFAARLAEIVEETAPDEARREFSKHRSLTNLAIFLLTRVKKIRPRDLSKFTLGLFGGEPLDPYREALEKAYGFKAYEMYLFTEFMPPAIECHVRDGMHLWLDICLPEIIPQSELDKESEDASYSPKTVPLWKAEQGMRGEYVLTSFGEALPLVRYRLADLVEVVSTKPCECGITHPRIKVPRRSDSTICLGAIRFPASQLEEKLLTATKYGQAQRWQLKMSREGYHPKPIIHIEPSGKIADRESFLKEISSKLHELEILRTGIETKIVAEPTVALVERISDEGRRIAKAGRIIHEGEY